MTGSDRRSIASALAALTAGAPLTPLTQDRSYLVLAGLLIGLSCALGIGVRRLHAGEPLVRIAQLLPAVVVPVLIPAVLDPLGLFEQTYSFIQTAFAPMPYDAGFAVFCAVLLWAVYLLCETLAIGLAAPAWTFPVLLLPYLVPTLAIYSETSPFLFVLPAAGYALVLATATATSAGADGGNDVDTVAGWRRGVATTATLSTVLALVGTVVVSLPIPERSAGAQSSGGQGSVQLGDPSLDLIRNVNSNSDQVVITYRTSDGDGEYLRLAALPAFDDRGFHLTATDLVPLSADRDGPAASTSTEETSITVGNLASEYLPTPWYPLTADVDPDVWRYDPKTLAVVAVGTGRTSATRGLSYETTSARLPAASALLPDLTLAGDPADGGLTLQLPDSLSDEVRQLAEQVTAGRNGAGRKALALAEFLRSDAFTYSTAVTPGTTLSTLDDFLLGSRIGYCEQFAGALAVMARVVGIPSRVVVGFLPGRKVGANWQVTPRNMHAWTELYFGGDVGWVPVDATPSGAVGNAGPSASPSATPTTASARPSVAPTTATPSVAPVTPTGPGSAPGNPLPWLIGVLVAGAAVAAGPRLVRAVQRQVRLAGSADPRRAAEYAWAEVRAVARDAGQDWPEGTTRQVAADIGPALDVDGRDALSSLALDVERVRYAETPGHPRALRERVERITAAMQRRWAPPTARVWWPRSLRPSRS
ncbi:MAG: transglutaminaseTgpA domain-containing protein [Propionicimonas sp.]|uniref:transglutaminaseTgpA domain-containing protein n=1 Tax=Propionicimonas sp. TaxID=1955623 RepID=UPI003D0DD92F